MAGKTSFDSTGRWAQECGRQRFADRCFARMAAWLALVSQTIKTEFPDFELSGPEKSAAETQRCLLRLSQMFDANSKQLYEEFQDLKPTAQRHRPVLSLFNGAYCLSCFPMLCPSRKSWVICKPGPWQSQVSAAAARTCLKHLPVSCWHRRLASGTRTVFVVQLLCLPKRFGRKASGSARNPKSVFD